MHFVAIHFSNFPDLGPYQPINLSLDTAGQIGAEKDFKFTYIERVSTFGNEYSKTGDCCAQRRHAPTLSTCDEKIRSRNYCAIESQLNIINDLQAEYDMLTLTKQE